MERVDCTVCLGNHIFMNSGKRMQRWYRHEPCENWLCGECEQKILREPEPTCPYCRKSMVGVGYAEEYPGWCAALIDRP